MFSIPKQFNKSKSVLQSTKLPKITPFDEDDTGTSLCNTFKTRGHKGSDSAY